MIIDDVLPPAVHTVNEQLCITSTFTFVLKVYFDDSTFYTLTAVNVRVHHCYLSQYISTV